MKRDKARIHEGYKYFNCECERCMDPEDDRLTSIKCTTEDCTAPVIITEISDPNGVKCSGCQTEISSDYVKKAQEMMLSLPTEYSIHDPEENIPKIKEKLQMIQEILHSENIYYCRLLTAYTQITKGSDTEFTNPDMHKLVYNNYRRCFPNADRHIGYQLLHLVRSLIEKGKRNEAIPYAYEAMSTFEICFGIDHPFYLQTLALWTFLDNRENKTDEELLNLMQFEYNRPVDISKLVEVTS